MQRAITFVLWCAAIPAVGFAQSKATQKPDPDRLGMTCAQILQMTLAEWIAKTAAINASNADGQWRGIRVYGECYEARTNRLAASLGRTGKAPRRDAVADFQSFDSALRDFAVKALAATNPHGDAVKAAYAALYEKQFRYSFYEGLEPKPANTARAEKSPVPAPSAKPTTPSAASSSNTPPAVTDDMTLAKNRFGELLGALPEDKKREIHAAFGEIVGAHALSMPTRLAVYRYAIFLLEPSSAKPFSPPPF